MIAIDASALVAIVLGEPEASACEMILDNESDLVMSAATLAEALIVSDRRKASGLMLELINGLRLQVLPVTVETAHRVSSIHARWGRGRHAANLNFGDCFAYDAATSSDCPLLFVGDDFSKTDIRSAL